MDFSNKISSKATRKTKRNTLLVSELKPFYICPVKLVATELHRAECDSQRKKMATLKPRFETEIKSYHRLPSYPSQQKN